MIALPDYAERERLNILIEECAEVITVATKILRHGWESSHPDYGNVPNVELLEKEIGHVYATVEMLLYTEDVDILKIREGMHAKFPRLKLYTQFQPADMFDSVNDD